MPRPLRIAHVITSTDPGGAETQLLRLMEHSPGGVEHRVACLRPLGGLAGAMEVVGARVASLDLAPGLGALKSGLGRLARLLEDWRPDVVQTWLYHADLLGLLAARKAFARRERPPVVWTLRCADMDLGRYGRSTRWVVAANKKLSRWPAAIVANSQAGAEWHQRLGYSARRLRVIPNGFDTTLFRPDPAARIAARQELGVPAGAIAAGRVARLDAMKDTPTLLAAARLALARRPDLRLVLVGAGMEPDQPQLAACARPPLAGRVTLTGHRRDVHRLLPALDFFVSSSLSEGMPGAVGEAMAAGLPCLVTDAGDSALLVGDAGVVVPPAEPYLLGQAMVDLAGRGRQELARMGRLARRRIEEGYSLERMVDAYLALYGEVLSSSRSRTRAQSAPRQEDQPTAST